MASAHTRKLTHPHGHFAYETLWHSGIPKFHKITQNYIDIDTSVANNYVNTVSANNFRRRDVIPVLVKMAVVAAFLPRLVKKVSADEPQLAQGISPKKQPK